MTWQILEGDCRDVLRSLPEQSVHTCVTSPPYFGLRDYGTGEWEGGDPGCDHLGEPFRTKASINANCGTGIDRKNTEDRQPMGQTCGKCGATRVDRQIGLEPTPDEFVAALVAVFREVRRVLRDDGTVWLNLGDSYAGAGYANRDLERHYGPDARNGGKPRHGSVALEGVKSKDLLGIPWLVAFALRADGWYLRSDIIWSKPNPMPESVTDRPTKAHEYVFLLSKGPRYFYDADAIREPHSREWWNETVGPGYMTPQDGRNDGGKRQGASESAGRNKRSVWTVATQPYAGAHFATFPPKLIEPCILAGAPERCCGECGAPWARVVEIESRPNWQGNGNQKHDGTYYRENIGGGVGNDRRERRDLGFEPSCTHDAPTIAGTVLDPFAGAGTTGLVALKHNRSFIGIELNPEYAEMARWRIRDDAPLLNTYSEIQEAAA